MGQQLAKFNRKPAIAKSQGVQYGSPFEEKLHWGKPRVKPKPQGKNGPVKIIKPKLPREQWKNV